MDSQAQRKMLETVWAEWSKVVTTNPDDQTPTPDANGDEGLGGGNTNRNESQDNSRPGHVEPRDSTQPGSDAQPGNVEPRPNARRRHNEAPNNQSLSAPNSSLRSEEASDGGGTLVGTPRTDCPLKHPVPELPGNEYLTPESPREESRLIRLEMFECFYEQVTKRLLERIEDPERNFEKDEGEKVARKAQRAAKKARIQDHRDARIRNFVRYRRQFCPTLCCNVLPECILGLLKAIMYTLKYLVWVPLFLFCCPFKLFWDILGASVRRLTHWPHCCGCYKRKKKYATPEGGPESMELVPIDAQPRPEQVGEIASAQEAGSGAKARWASTVTSLRGFFGSRATPAA